MTPQSVEVELTRRAKRQRAQGDPVRAIAADLDLGVDSRRGLDVEAEVIRGISARHERIISKLQYDGAPRFEREGIPIRPVESEGRIRIGRKYECACGGAREVAPIVRVGVLRLNVDDVVDVDVVGGLGRRLDHLDRGDRKAPDARRRRRTRNDHA